MKTTLVSTQYLYRSAGHDFRGRHGKGRCHHGIEDRSAIELISGRGIVGDRYFDHKPDFKGQITFFEAEVWEAVKAQFGLPDLAASSFRRNVVVRGIDLNELIGKTFTYQGITFSGSEEAKPCYWMEEACAPGVEKFLRGKGGLRCRIHSDGSLKVASASALEVVASPSR